MFLYFSEPICNLDLWCDTMTSCDIMAWRHDVIAWHLGITRFAVCVDPSWQKDLRAKELYNMGRGRCVNAQVFSFYSMLNYSIWLDPECISGLADWCQFQQPIPLPLGAPIPTAESLTHCVWTEVPAQAIQNIRSTGGWRVEEQPRSGEFNEFHSSGLEFTKRNYLSQQS